MLAEKLLLTRAKKMVEAKLGWGDSKDWSNQDFLALSKKIQEEINVSVSHVTLKRIWGKVKYDSLPNTYTLNILAQFAGYENWRDFKIKTGSDPITPETSTEIPATDIENKFLHVPDNRPRHFKMILAAVILIVVAASVVLFVYSRKKKIDPADYSFSSKIVLNKGVPNSVIFDYNALKAPTDSVIIQQSWDTTLRTTVSKNEHQHTLLYFFPGFFKPKLIVNNQIVKEHNLLIKSDGWLTAVETSPVPVYFKKEDAIANGKMSLSVDKIKAQHINITPQAPLVVYSNVRDFGEIYSDDFVFETLLKNDYHEGSSACQTTNIYLLCEGTAIGIPLCAKGCISGINLMFAGFSVSGKQKDLSAFGVDFSAFVKVRIESANGKAKIFLNDKFVYEVDHDINKAKIVGIDFIFQGAGTVDYVKLSNAKTAYADGF